MPISFIALLIVIALIAWAFWQIGWRGGSKDRGRWEGGAGGDTFPMW